MSLFVWMVLGAAAGWLSDTVLKRGGYGQAAEIVLGVLGGVAAGILTGVVLHMNTVGGFNVETIVGAFAGAVVAIALSRVYKYSRASA